MNDFIAKQQILKLSQFITQYATINKSIISNTFYFIEKSSLKCLTCNFISNNFNCQMYIIFPLKEIQNFLIMEKFQNSPLSKSMNYNNMMMAQNNSFYNNMFGNFNCMNNNFTMFQNNFMMNQINQMNQMNQIQNFINMNQNLKVNLIDGFRYNANKKNNFNGQNQICCEFCKNKTNAIENSSFYSLSDILIINLNRGKNNIYKVPINIVETLDLTNEVETKNDINVYDLISVITHFGNSGTDGHYIAFCKVQNKNMWYKFNDSIVTESKFEEASTTGDAYILFYQRRKN